MKFGSCLLEGNSEHSFYFVFSVTKATAADLLNTIICLIPGTFSLLPGAIETNIVAMIELMYFAEQIQGKGLEPRAR